MRGGHQSPPKANLHEILWAWVGSFVGIAAVAYINQKLVATTDQMMLNNLSKIRKYPMSWW